MTIKTATMLIMRKKMKKNFRKKWLSQNNKRYANKVVFVANNFVQQNKPLLFQVFHKKLHNLYSKTTLYITY